jgi:hypothetical protein
MAEKRKDETAEHLILKGTNGDISVNREWARAMSVAINTALDTDPKAADIECHREHYMTKATLQLVADHIERHKGIPPYDAVACVNSKDGQNHRIEERYKAGVQREGMTEQEKAELKTVCTEEYNALLKMVRNETAQFTRLILAANYLHMDPLLGIMCFVIRTVGLQLSLQSPEFKQVTDAMDAVNKATAAAAAVPMEKTVAKEEEDDPEPVVRRQSKRQRTHK